MASGQTLAKFKPYSNEPPATLYARLDTRNQHPVLDFNKSTDWSAIFSDVLISSYGGGGITAYIHWSADGVTTNNVTWDVSFERIGDGEQDVDSNGFASIQSVTDAAPGTDGFVTIANIPFTDGAQIDSIEVGELYRLKITRDASDTLDADAQLHFIELQET